LQLYNALTPRVFYTELIDVELQSNKILFYPRFGNSKIAPTLPMQSLNKATKLGTLQVKELVFRLHFPYHTEFCIGVDHGHCRWGDLFTSNYCG